MEDPLKNIFPEIAGNLFHHFENQEILKLTEVSKFWNDFIGDSPLMRNFCLKLVWNSNCDLANYSRSRKYQNIIVDFSQYKERKVLEFLLQSQNIWKKIEFFNGDITNKLMEFLDETVVSVTLKRINLERNSTDENLMMFPCLKALKIFSCNSATVDVFKNCQTLQLLEFAQSLDEDNGTSFKSILLNNSELKSLRVYTSSLASLLPEVNNLIMFQLRELFIFSNFNEDDRKCLNRFLQLQSSFLKIIAINGNIDSRILKTCFEMGQLCQLSVEHSWDSVELATNESIKRLDLSFNDGSLSVYGKLLEALPNLRIFKTQFMDESSLKCLMTNCKVLEELYVENFDASSVPDKKSFPQLKIFRSWN